MCWWKRSMPSMFWSSIWIQSWCSLLQKHNFFFSAFKKNSGRERVNRLLNAIVFWVWKLNFGLCCFCALITTYFQTWSSSWFPNALHSNCAFTPQAARASKWPEVIHFQWEPAASSGESGAASFGWWERRGELKSSQLYGNELWRGSAATNRNVEVLRLRGVQRTQSCKLWFRPH